MQNDTCVAAHTCDRKICMDTVAPFDVSALSLAILHRKDLLSCFNLFAGLAHAFSRFSTFSGFFHIFKVS